MTDRWYMVKRNWPQTVSRSPRFAGVGGDVWPLDALADKGAKAMHATMMASRKHVVAGSCEELVCVDLSVAEAYWVEAETRLGDVWLLEVAAAASGIDVVTGFDLGFLSGGFSLVETELIVQSLPGPLLNDWGLIGQVTDALAYLAHRVANEELEQLDRIEPLAVRVVRRSGATF